uniref:glutathione transferase n=1 Tax=Lygus hesperus TaxID=30085 RepID=A0A0A9YRT1_LYGHE
MSVELTYFNMSGLGEPVRVMLSYGEIPFTDKRVSKDEWASMKSEMTFGQMPRLLIDGLELYQSRAICRYIAGKLNLRGKTDKAAAMADMWVDAIDDARSMIARVYYQPDSEERTINMDKMKNVDFPRVLSIFEKELEKNGTTFLVGNEVSWADIMLFGYLSYIGELLRTTGSDLLSAYPRLTAIYSTILSNPGIQKYLANRPASPADMRVLFDLAFRY